MTVEWYLGVDPGLKTGVALVRRDGDLAERVWSHELDVHEVAPAIRPLLTWWQVTEDARLTVVAESFTITARTATNSQAPWSLEVLGVLKQCMRDVGMEPELPHLVMQKPSVKQVVDNPKLRRVELWHVGGAGHANDALRHVAVRLISVGWRDPRLLG